MSLSLLTSADAVREALAEYDQLGKKAFLAKYGFGAAHDYFVEYNGRLYDSKAIAGVAVGFERPERGPLGAGDFVGGGPVATKLGSLGFTVIDTREREAAVSPTWWVNQGE